MAFLSSTQGIRDEVASRLNELESDSTDVYTGWINLGIRDVARTVPNASFFQTSADRTLSSGTRIYTLPADFDRMNDVILPAADVKLTYVEPEQFDILQPSATEGGNPYIYTMRGIGGAAPTIEFYPQPGSSVTMHYNYQKLPTTVSLASAVPDIPEKYLELLVMFAEAQGLKRKGLRTDANAVLQEYENLKQKMIQDLTQQTNESKWIKNPRDFMAGRRDFGDPIKNIFHYNP